MAAIEVRLRGGAGFAKVRSPVWPVVWTVVTLGIYGAYWWYQVNRELRDLGRIHGRPELGDSPGTSLLAVTLGALIIVPPFVSLYRGCQRILAAQDLAGIEERDRLNGWIALALVVVGFLVAFIPLVIAFLQSELNKVWENPAMAEDHTGALAARAAAPPTIQPVAAAASPVTPAPPAPSAQQPSAAGEQAEPAAAQPAAADPQIDRLERLAALRDSGAITPDEYEAQKAKILAEL